MFTGLVEGIGRVKDISRVGEDMTLTVQPLFPMSDIRVGESISVNGVCVTVTIQRGETFSVDVSAETISRSTMGRLRMAEEVNLERSLRLADRLGGHLVLGHVDGVGRVLRKDQRQRSWVFEFGVDEGLSRYIIEKGSIAVDGVSLTVNRCGAGSFEVNIIPQTGRETNLLKRSVGDLVNIETDMIGKYVEKLFQRDRPGQPTEGSSGINKEMLRKYGFGD